MADTELANEMLRASLAQFHGTKCWYWHMLSGGKTMYTDGVKFLAEKAQAFWLIDEIALANRFTPLFAKHPFQVWKLRKDPEKKNEAEWTVEDGNKNVIYRKHLDFTDFPLSEIDVWCVDNVIMLPSEY